MDGMGLDYGLDWRVTALLQCLRFLANSGRVWVHSLRKAIYDPAARQLDLHWQGDLTKSNDSTKLDDPTFARGVSHANLHRQ